MLKLGDQTQRNRIAEMAASLKRDFAAELADTPQTTIQECVAASVDRMTGYGFRDGAMLYKLAAWELFYGEHYETSLGDGSLSKICQDTGIPEAVKYERFVRRISSPEFEALLDGTL